MKESREFAIEGVGGTQKWFHLFGNVCAVRWIGDHYIKATTRKDFAEPKMPEKKRPLCFWVVEERVEARAFAFERIKFGLILRELFLHSSACLIAFVLPFLFFFFGVTDGE